MKLYVYKIKEDVKTESWDDIDYNNDLELVHEIEGETNEECEEKMYELGFDPDCMTSTYTRI